MFLFFGVYKKLVKLLLLLLLRKTMVDGPTVVALRPGPSPVAPPALGRVCVPLDHRRYEASVADWKWRGKKTAVLTGDQLLGGGGGLVGRGRLFEGRCTH